MVRDIVKKLMLLVVCILLTAGATACPDGEGHKNAFRPRFSPEEYQQRERAFITKKADLTQAEASAFFPLFHQMKDRQRKLSFKNGKMMRKAWKGNLSLAILKAVMENEEDIIELEEKYQKKFLKVVSASKLLKIKVAEKAFERRMLSNMAHGPRPRGPEK